MDVTGWPSCDPGRREVPSPTRSPTRHRIGRGPSRRSAPAFGFGSTVTADQLASCSVSPSTCISLYLFFANGSTAPWRRVRPDPTDAFD